MKLAASRNSSSSFGVFGDIDGLARLIDRFDEVRVAQGSGRNQVDSSAQQRSERFLQAEIAVEKSGRIAIELDQEVKIAAL
jgi:hypothetical protein